jgi:mercuric reductase
MTGGCSPLDLSAMSAVIFTDPQVAMVDYSEQEATRASRPTAVFSPWTTCRGRSRTSICQASSISSPKPPVAGSQRSGTPDTSERLQSAALAIRARVIVWGFADPLFPCHTMVDGLKFAAQTFSKDTKRPSCHAGQERLA